MTLKQGKISSRALTTQRRNPVKSGEINFRRSQFAASPRGYQKSLCNSSVQPPETPSPAKLKPVQVRPTTSPGHLERSHSTANTPRFCPTNRSTNFAPRYSTSGMLPGYMASTESAKSRLRSQSAPRHRPSTPDRERDWSAKRCLSYSIHNLRTPKSKNGEAAGSEYSCNTDSVGGEISPCSTTNSRWWSR